MPREGKGWTLQTVKPYNHCHWQGHCHRPGPQSNEYYLKKYVALLIRKTINAVTVMFAVMKIIQQIINAVTVIPVKMYQTISKHIMFRCHCRFLLEIWLFEIFFGWCWNSKQICSREFPTSTNSTFMRPPRAGMHTKRSASTS